MQKSQLVVRGIALAWLISGAGSWPHAVRAQTFEVGRLPRDVALEVLEKPYTIQGGTAQELLRQMLELGPGGFASFPYFYQWRYTAEELTTAFTRNASGVCHIRDFEVRFAITANFPTWVQPPGAPPALVAAWEDFQGLVRERWEERRDGVMEFGSEISRAVRRVEEACPLMQSRTQEVVERFRDADNEAAMAAALSGERVAVRWPPASYSDVAASDQPPSPIDPTRSTTGSPPPDASVPRAPPIPEGLYEALNLDLERADTLRVVAGIRHLGEIRVLQAFGSDESLGVRGSIEFPAFSDLLLATLATVLERRGVVDLRSPLVTYLPELSPRLGAVTLEQLLSHRSGLDDSRPQPTTEWSVALRGLDDAALFTDPGAVYSYSLYNYSLAAIAIERATNASLGDLVRDVLLEPAGMDSTFLTDAPRGLPVAHTSGFDLMSFLAAWLEGRFEGTSVFPSTGGWTVPARGERAFAGGVWRDYVGTHPRASLICDAREGHAVGIEIFPETNTAVVLLGKEWPTNTARFMLNLVAIELDIGAEIFRPLPLVGDGKFAVPAGPCVPPTWNDQRVADAGVVTLADDWPGRYTNGGRQFILQADAGNLVAIPFERPLAVTRLSEDLYFATLGGRPFFPLSLTRDEAGRRYVVLEDVAFIHDEDRPRN